MWQIAAYYGILAIVLLHKICGRESSSTKQTGYGSKIVELVQSQGSVQVEELAQELNVSAMTIRRELVKLQKEDVLKRCHGGAVAKQEVTYADKQTGHVKNQSPW